MQEDVFRNDLWFLSTRVQRACCEKMAISPNDHRSLLLAAHAIPNPKWREFVCGWGAAFINITVTFPINKVMFRQVPLEIFNNFHLITYSCLSRCFMACIQRQPSTSSSLKAFASCTEEFCLHYVRKQYQCLSCLVCTTTISKYWILWCLTGIHTLRIQLQLLQLAWQRHCSLHLREFRCSSKIATTTRGSKIQHMPLLTFVNTALESTIEASRRYYCETASATRFSLPCEMRSVCACLIQITGPPNSCKTFSAVPWYALLWSILFATNPFLSISMVGGSIY